MLHTFVARALNKQSSLTRATLAICMLVPTVSEAQPAHELHIRIINAKTAALFSAAAEVGPAICGRDRAERAAFRSYGSNLGLAFQLIDDALDYGGSSAELGKHVGEPLFTDLPHRVEHRAVHHHRRMVQADQQWQLR